MSYSNHIFLFRYALEKKMCLLSIDDGSEHIKK